MISTNVWFDNDGWLHSGENSWITVHHRPTKRKWTGMHPIIKSKYNDQLHGTVTHYDALPNAERTVRGFTNGKKGASTHFVISRKGVIYQLASIKDRTWHAGFKRDADGKVVEWPETNGQMLLANGVYTESPNHWCVGIDLSNWGWLTASNGKYYSHAKTEVRIGDVFFDANGRPWEKYTEDAKEAYTELMVALTLELDIIEGMHYRHEDTSPTRKTDPGPALPFHSIIKHVYKLVESYALYDDYDFDRMGNNDDLIC